MAKITLLVKLNYDAEIMHGQDAEAREWFLRILKGGGLTLHSDEIGDSIGAITVLSTDPDMALPTRDGLCAVCNKPASYHEDHDYVAPGAAICRCSHDVYENVASPGNCMACGKPLR